MYKVFIDNTSKTYQLDEESELLKVFEAYKFIKAGGGLVRRGDKVLFIKRHGKWDIPKGKLDEGETIESCAVREVEEECGLKCPKIVEHLIDTWHTYETHKGTKVLKKTFWYLMDEGEVVDLIPQLEEGITELGFYGQEDFNMIKENTYPSIVDVLDKYEARINA